MLREHGVVVLSFRIQIALPLLQPGGEEGDVVIAEEQHIVEMKITVGIARGKALEHPPQVAVGGLVIGAVEPLSRRHLIRESGLQRILILPMHPRGKRERRHLIRRAVFIVVDILRAEHRQRQRQQHRRQNAKHHNPIQMLFQGSTPSNQNQRWKLYHAAQ